MVLLRTYRTYPDELSPDANQLGIILGLMGILGIEFNIINIILSTFIFGIGDDFSIFIMDGLQNKYRTGQKVLNSHKTAIFFSAFTTVVGMGALVFAKHPALQSISLISILGMIAVVLVAYTIQPLIFRFFIAGPASKGLPPYTLIGLIRTVLLFLLFFIGCIVPPYIDYPALSGACAQKQQAAFGVPLDTNHLQRNFATGHRRQKRTYQQSQRTLPASGNYHCQPPVVHRHSGIAVSFI